MRGRVPRAAPVRAGSLKMWAGPARLESATQDVWVSLFFAPCIESGSEPWARMLHHGAQTRLGSNCCSLRLPNKGPPALPLLVGSLPAATRSSAPPAPPTGSTRWAPSSWTARAPRTWWPWRSSRWGQGRRRASLQTPCGSAGLIFWALHVLNLPRLKARTHSAPRAPAPPRQGVKKFVLVTSIGCDDPLFPLNAYWGVLFWKKQVGRGRHASVAGGGRQGQGKHSTVCLPSCHSQTPSSRMSLW